MSIVASASQRSRLQNTFDASLPDLGVRLAWSAGPTDDAGNTTDVYTAAGTSIACGFNGKSTEVMAGSQVVLTDGSLRLPIGTVIDHRDRWRLTHRYGTALSSPPVFEILGMPLAGPMGLVVDLRLITDRSST